MVLSLSPNVMTRRSGFFGKNYAISRMKVVRGDTIPVQKSHSCLLLIEPHLCYFCTPSTTKLVQGVFLFSGGKISFRTGCLRNC